jgi:hypothetical protein
VREISGESPAAGSFPHPNPLPACGERERAVIASRSYVLVMAGLDPAIHVFVVQIRKPDVDARDKRGHDG